jgi:hypothetical protein
METSYLYEKYENCDIILCCYLETTGQDVDCYNCFDFAEWERNKFDQFKSIHGYTDKLYDRYIEFLLGN